MGQRAPAAIVAGDISLGNGACPTGSPEQAAARRGPFNIDRRAMPAAGRACAVSVLLLSHLSLALRVVSGVNKNRGGWTLEL